MLNIRVEYTHDVPNGPDDVEEESIIETFNNVDDAIAFLGSMQRHFEVQGAKVNQIISEDSE